MVSGLFSISHIWGIAVFCLRKTLYPKPLYFFLNAMFPLRGDNFLQGIDFIPCTPKLRTTESDVLGRGQGRLER